MKPESGTCRVCKTFNDHLIIDGNYICSKCGFVTKIITWEECEQKLNEIKKYWMEVEKNNPEYFVPELLSDSSDKLSQVEIVTKKKPGLN